MPHSALAGLLDEDRAYLLDHRLTLSVSTDLVTEYGGYPSTQEHWVEVMLDYHMEGDPALPEELSDGERAILAWSTSENVTPDDDGRLAITVGTIGLMSVGLDVGNPFEALDELGGDATMLASALLHPSSDGRRLLNEMRTYGTRALLIDDVRIRPEYRGHRISITALRMLLDAFRHGTICALLYPMDRDTQGPDARAESKARLTRHWAHAGFRVWDPRGVMVLDLDDLRDLDEK